MIVWTKINQQRNAKICLFFEKKICYSDTKGKDLLCSSSTDIY